MPPHDEPGSDEGQSDSRVEVVQPHHRAQHAALDEDPHKENASLKGGPEAGPWLLQYDEAEDEEGKQSVGCEEKDRGDEIRVEGRVLEQAQGHDGAALRCEEHRDSAGDGTESEKCQTDHCDSTW